MVRILEAYATPPWKMLIILANQPSQPGARGIDQGMDPLPVGSYGIPSEVCFQNGHGRGRREDVRTPPGCEQGERSVDQLSFVLGRGSCAKRGLISSKEVRALKAALDLVRQPPFNAPDIVMIKDLRGQVGDVPRLIAVEEAAQCDGDMTGIAVHRPPDEALDVAHQPVIRGRPLPRVLAGSRSRASDARYTQYWGRQASGSRRL
jgi:hypothetical protein